MFFESPRVVAIPIGQIAIIVAGALLGGLVNGLTGFGTGLTAMGVWLYTLPPPVAATLVIICSVVSQIQTLPMIWHAIEWRRTLWFVIPGLLGVPLGTVLISHVQPRPFKIGVGLFLVAYATYALIRTPHRGDKRAEPVAEGGVGFCGGVLGGLAGFSGPPVILWTDIRGYGKEDRRCVLQTFNLSILAAALAAHAWSGLLTGQVGLAAVAAIPAAICGAWFGARIYRQLGDRGFQKIVLGLLLLSGVALIWTSR